MPNVVEVLLLGVVALNPLEFVAALPKSDDVPVVPKFDVAAPKAGGFV